VGSEERGAVSFQSNQFLHNIVQNQEQRAAGSGAVKMNKFLNLTATEVAVN
jgi:hypothetical protein